MFLKECDREYSQNFSHLKKIEIKITKIKLNRKEKVWSIFTYIC